MLQVLLELKKPLQIFANASLYRSIRKIRKNIISFFRNRDDIKIGSIVCNNANAGVTSFAKEGIKLIDFSATQPVCSASRASYLTGCYPNRIGIHNALMPDAKIGLNPEEITIADMLKEQGYNTAIFGKWHLGDAPEFMPTKQGFDEYFGIPYSNDMWPHHPQQGPIFNFDPLPLYQNEKVIDTLNDQSLLTTQITEHAVSFIQKNKNNPFFLYVAHPQPHVPLFVSDKFKGKSERGLYGDVIMEIDWSVGEILKTLKAEIIVTVSNNGIALRRDILRS